MNLLIIEDNRFMSAKILIEFSECMKEKQYTRPCLVSSLISNFSLRQIRLKLQRSLSTNIDIEY